MSCRDSRSVQVDVAEPVRVWRLVETLLPVLDRGASPVHTVRGTRRCRLQLHARLLCDALLAAGADRTLTPPFAGHAVAAAAALFGTGHGPEGHVDVVLVDSRVVGVYRPSIRDLAEALLAGVPQLL